MLKLTIYIPETHLDAVKDAVFAAGAGNYGNYDRCCWQVLGQGQFRPQEGSHAFIGISGIDTTVREYRVEMICPEARASAVTHALRVTHPYEEPAFDFVKIEAIE